MERHEELATKLSLAAAKAHKLTEEKQVLLEKMSDLETILREIRDFCHENSEAFKEIRMRLKKLIKWRRLSGASWSPRTVSKPSRGYIGASGVAKTVCG